MRYYTIEIIVDLDVEDLQEFNNAALEAAGHSSSAGYGFGQRDMSWWTETFPEAIELATKLVPLQAKYPSLTLSICPNEEESDVPTASAISA